MLTHWTFTRDASPPPSKPLIKSMEHWAMALINGATASCTMQIIHRIPIPIMIANAAVNLYPIKTINNKHAMINHEILRYTLEKLSGYKSPETGTAFYMDVVGKQELDAIHYCLFCDGEIPDMITDKGLLETVQYLKNLTTRNNIRSPEELRHYYKISWVRLSNWARNNIPPHKNDNHENKNS